MNTIDIFKSSFTALEKSLDLRSKKHNLLTSNVANFDTPNYKPFNLNVEEAIQHLKGSENQIKMNSPDSNHIAGTRHNKSKSDDAYRFISKEDKSIDIEKTMVDLSENSILYNATAQILSKKYNALKQAITGGSR